MFLHLSLAMLNPLRGNLFNSFSFPPSTFPPRAVKLVTEASAAVCGQDSRDGFIRARIHHREEMPVFRTKADILATFPKPS